MVVATCADNVPTQRVVLLKRFDTEGFVVLHQLQQPKGQQLAVNPNCQFALCLATARTPNSYSRRGTAF